MRDVVKNFVHEPYGPWSLPPCFAHRYRRADIAVNAPGQRRILIVDDDADRGSPRRRCSKPWMMLRDMGHELHTAEDGELAVAAAEKFRPDVARLDLEMPKLNSDDACRRIRSEPWGKAMVLIAVTGSGTSCSAPPTPRLGSLQENHGLSTGGV